MDILSNEDIECLQEHGVSPTVVVRNLSLIKGGVDQPEIVRTANVDDGILAFSDSDVNRYVDSWSAFLSKGKSIVSHFIPASGNANRFFRDLYAFLNASYDAPQTNFEKNFFRHIQSFAFYSELNQFCVETEKESVDTLIEQGKYKLVVEYLLTKRGLNYSSLPSALFKFHTDKSKKFMSVSKYIPKSWYKYYSSFENTRTPIQEALIEAAMVSGVKGRMVNVDFTVRAEHKEAVHYFVEQFKLPIEKRLGITYNVGLPIQNPSTDTVLLDKYNKPFHDQNGRLVFHQGGHGALMGNFSDLESDVVFIKNIDNEPIDSLKKLSAQYKKVMGGVLVENTKLIGKYLRLLDKGNVSESQLIEIINYVENVLNIKDGNILQKNIDDQYAFLREKLNRPLRVCAMVKNEDEQGGVPCWVRNADGTSSLQIVEFYQASDNEDYMKMFARCSHFNPVDMVCSMTDYKGKKFNFGKYADDAALIVYPKPFEGEETKAVELPGLWNGCMAGWNTIFIEAPVKTFNPVKTINDLLRNEHQIEWGE